MAMIKVTWALMFGVISWVISTTFAQTSITNTEFKQWLESRVDFIAFDIRGKANPDSIVYPAYYTNQAEKWVKSLNCRKRLLIYCNLGATALKAAKAIAANGYPADSIYTSGYSILTASRRPAADTLPLSLIDLNTPFPDSLSAFELQSIIPSKRDYLIIDVRSPSETAAGMIPGACNIVWPDQFKANTGRMGRTQEIVLYCRSGRRANEARSHLLSLGYNPELVVNFGGFSKWQAAFKTQTTSPSPKCTCQKATIASVSDFRFLTRKRSADKSSNYIFDAAGRRYKLDGMTANKGRIWLIGGYLGIQESGVRSQKSATYFYNSKL